MPQTTSLDNLRVRFTPTSTERLPNDVVPTNSTPIQRTAPALYDSYGAASSRGPRLTETIPKFQLPRESPHSRTHEAGNNTINSGPDTERILETMCTQMALTRIPVSEPDKFDGRDPLSFPVWRIAFDSLIGNRAMTNTDKLNLLNKYLDGEAKSAIRGYLMLSPDRAFADSYGLLMRRYGDKSQLANDFLTQLRNWPKINGTDNVGLRRYVDFLYQCETTMEDNRAMRVLDDESENMSMLKKLPVWLARKWSRKVATYREEHGEYPAFSYYVEFIAREDRIAHDPVSKILYKDDRTKSQVRGGSFASENRSVVGPGSNFGITCTYCSERHSILRCDKFRLKTIEFRQNFVRDNRLCFGCLAKGHQARECRSRKDCQICNGRHPTAMHIYEGPVGEPAPTSIRHDVCEQQPTELHRKKGLHGCTGACQSCGKPQ